MHTDIVLLWLSLCAAVIALCALRMAKAQRECGDPFQHSDRKKMVTLYAVVVFVLVAVGLFAGGILAALIIGIRWLLQ
jgi:hypothetical protein